MTYKPEGGFNQSFDSELYVFLIECHEISFSERVRRETAFLVVGC